MGATEYLLVAKGFELTLSILKTKAMAVKREVTAEDKTPLRVGKEQMEVVK